jgi:hypothetical protein
MRVGSVVYATSQGLGHLAKDFYDNGIVTDVMVFRHPGGIAKSHMNWYPRGTHEWKERPFKGPILERWLSKLDVVLCFETPFDWAFLDKARSMGVKTAIMPMYEWFLERPPHVFDLFINPSLLDQKYFPQGIHIPVPVKQEWKLRTTATKWLHNAGNIGCRGHKGTLELLKAMKYVESPIDLTVRCQNANGLRKLIRDAECISDSRIKYVAGEIPYNQLYADHDVAIVPEKFNGLSLPLQEAFASGLMVMTTDRFPTNTWLPKEPLIPVSQTQEAQTMRGHLPFEECIVDPEDIAATIDVFHQQSIEKYSLLGRQYGIENSWDVLKPRYISALESIL